jgi:predicted transcriptional regulator
MVKVSDVMNTDIASVPDTSSAVQAAAVILEKRVNSVVVKKGDETVGIMTDKDFVRLAALGGNPRGVTSNMSTDLVTISPDADLNEAVNLMKEKEVRHLLVREGDKIIGIVSTKDINRALANILANM